MAEEKPDISETRTITISEAEGGWVVDWYRSGLSAESGRAVFHDEVDIAQYISDFLGLVGLSSRVAETRQFRNWASNDE